jgi:hypothetical protein
MSEGEIYKVGDGDKTNSLDMLTFFLARSPDAPRTAIEDGLRHRPLDLFAVSLTDYNSLLFEAVYFARHL